MGPKIFFMKCGQFLGSFWQLFGPFWRRVANLLSILAAAKQGVYSQEYKFMQILLAQIPAFKYTEPDRCPTANCCCAVGQRSGCGGAAVGQRSGSMYLSRANNICIDLYTGRGIPRALLVGLLIEVLGLHLMDPGMDRRAAVLRERQLILFGCTPSFPRVDVLVFVRCERNSSFFG